MRVHERLSLQRLVWLIGPVQLSSAGPPLLQRSRNAKNPTIRYALPLIFRR
jgi:hypothetical protein